METKEREKKLETKYNRNSLYKNISDRLHSVSNVYIYTMYIGVYVDLYWKHCNKNNSYSPCLIDVILDK